MSKLLKKSIFTLGIILLPAFALAAETNETVGSILASIQNLLGIIVPIIMTLALLYFLWGLAQYILGAGNDEKRKEGRDMMIYGIIALFVMAAVWGLVAVVSNTFDIDTGGNIPNLPGVPIIEDPD